VTQAFAAQGTNQRSTMAFAWDARTEVRMTRTLTATAGEDFLVGLDRRRADLVGQQLVGFQNSATVSDQRFQAAGSYSLMSPPRTGRRRILPWAGWGTGTPGRGGRSWRARCGRCVL
jgi:hypothetical protein